MTHVPKRIWKSITARLSLLRNSSQTPTQEELRGELQATIDAVNRSCRFCCNMQAAPLVVYEPGGGEAAYLCYEHLGPFLESWVSPHRNEWLVVRQEMR